MLNGLTPGRRIRCADSDWVTDRLDEILEAAIDDAIVDALFAEIIAANWPAPGLAPRRDRVVATAVRARPDRDGRAYPPAGAPTRVEHGGPALSPARRQRSPPPAEPESRTTREDGGSINRSYWSHQLAHRIPPTVHHDRDRGHCDLESPPA